MAQDLIYTWTQGICIVGSVQAVVQGNTVNVTAASTTRNELVLVGYAAARGIGVWGSDQARVVSNGVILDVDVEATTAVSLLVSAPATDELVSQLFGPVALGYAEGIGIRVVDCFAPVIYDNTVDVDVDVLLVALGVAPCEFTGGTALAVGIKVQNGDYAQVDGNTVHAHALSDQSSVEFAVDLKALSLGLSAGLGIVLIDCDPALVAGNSVDASGELWLFAHSGPGLFEEGAESAVAKLDSEVLGAIFGVVVETLESEAVGADLSGSPLSIGSFAAGGGIAAGLGIVALGCDGVQITANDPVNARGEVYATVLAGPVMVFDAVALGGGLGLGIGILTVACYPAVVTDNGVGQGTVTATGNATVTVIAQEGVDFESAAALGGGAGIGVGIALIGNGGWAEASGNAVSAAGDAQITANATSDVPGESVFASGAGLGVGLGIVVINHPGALVADNVVDATGSLWADVQAESVETYDPVAFGLGAGIGVGIVTALCPGVQVLDNDTSGTGMAYVEVGATEYALEQEIAFGFGAGLGIGMGILVVGCSDALVSGNEADGTGDVEVNVIVTEMVPLGEAWEIALGAGVGKGIVVAFSPRAMVVECNTAWGDGSARISSTAIADFTYEWDLGVAVDLDILVLLSENSHVNYNSMVDPAVEGTNSGPVLLFDAGLLNIGPWLNGEFNWWNHPTGPSGFGPGFGEPVIWCGSPVFFVPWLTLPHDEVLEGHIGYYAKPIELKECWNSLSAPYALDPVADELAEIAALTGLNYDVAYWWDPVAQEWVQVTVDNDLMEPLHGMYIKMNAPGWAIFMTSPDDSLPTRVLQPGWNLIGPNPMFCMPYMPVDEALSSILLTPAGLPGYTQVISPFLASQEAWYYVPGMEPEDMETGKAYWVFMENEDILAGFGFTPIPAPMP